MLKALAFALCMSATAGSSLLLSAPAGAADDAMMKMDCSKASMMMMDASKMGTTTAMTPSGDTDKDFMAMMMDREKGTNKMLHIEAMCGKDDKMKAMAAKEAESSDQRMAMFRNTNTSQ